MPRMRAAQIAEMKGPIEIVEREIPEPGAGFVRLKVEACGVCHSDSFTKEGTLPGIQYPRIPGHEIAGIMTQSAQVSPVGQKANGSESAGMADTAAAAILAVA